MRDYRNIAVHHGSEHSEILLLVNELKYFVEVLINFHTSNKVGFNSLDDANKYLDQSPLLNDLQKSKMFAEHAILFKK